MSPAWIAAAVTGAGFACLAWATDAWPAENEPAARPWLLWEVAPDRAMPRVRGSYTASTACAVDLASLANVLPAGSRLSCVKQETKR